jgi:hypothetical protein
VYQLSKIGKVCANFGLGSKWQKEVYEWAKEQGGENVSEWLKSTLHHLYLKWKEENVTKQVIRTDSGGMMIRKVNGNNPDPNGPGK